MPETTNRDGHGTLGRTAMDTSPKGTALITIASSGMGAIYADRLARRGHDLILVARNRERLDALATRIAKGTGRSVDVIVADLNDSADLARIEQVLSTDPAITLEGDANGAPHVAPAVYAGKFAGKYEHRTLTGGIGHNPPQEAPREFAQAIIDVDGF
jgi:uncharacterized protein